VALSLDDADPARMHPQPVDPADDGSALDSAEPSAFALVLASFVDAPAPPSSTPPSPPTPPSAAAGAGGAS
jgi:hypothetical protein